MSEGQRRWKPQPSTVIASIALFVALVGTAYASVAKNQVKSKHIKNGQVKAVDVNSSQVQLRVGSSCPSGQAIRVVNVNGTVACEVDDAGAGGAAGPAGGDLTGTYPNPLIADNAVTTAKIADNAVTTAKIADNAVTTAKIADNAVTSAKVVNETLTTNDIATDAIMSDEIQNGQVTQADIGTAAVHADELGDIVQVATTDSVANNTSAILDAACPAGTQLISGGGGINLAGPPAGVQVTATLRIGNSWRTIVRNQSGAAQPTFTQVHCLEA